MKAVKLFLLFLLLGLSLAPINALAVEELDSLHVVGCDHWVSLREEPSVSAKRLAQVPLRAIVTYLGEMKNGFARVNYGGENGYILTRYLSDEDISVPMYVANCREYISLRSTASTKALRLTRIPLGAEVECLSTLDNESEMMYVRYGGQTGFVLRRYLSYLPIYAKTPLLSASLHVTTPNGRDYVQTITDEKALTELANMLRNATPGYAGKCPFGAQLVLELPNGSILYLAYPTDGCSSFIAENFSVYSFNTSDGDKFWEIFDLARNAMRY